jgi:hypothetical protein
MKPVGWAKLLGTAIIDLHGVAQFCPRVCAATPDAWATRRYAVPNSSALKGRVAHPTR